jgi:DinB superfamily
VDSGMDIVPDTKDWTWVLQRECPECGFDARAIAKEEVADLVRENAEAWQEVFAGRTDLRLRPRPDVWSPLEYACHVRDVFRLYDQRLKLMLSEDDPTYPNWDQDATAVEERYPEQDPQRVIIELRLAAEAIAASFAKVEGDQWRRTGNRSDGARFTVDTFARYFIHDPIHHLNDVTKEY